MTEEVEEEETFFDAEWEIRKFGRRLLDIMDLIDELKAKDKSLSARISRLRLETIEEGEEDESPSSAPPRDGLDHLTIEQKAILYSKLIDQSPPETP